MKNPRIRIPLIIAFSVVFCLSTIAQDDSQTRSITSDDFARQRPRTSSKSSTRASSRNNAARRKVTYRLSRQSKAPLWTGKTNAHKAVHDGPTQFSKIGVTLWRMRPPLPGEAGFRLPVSIKNSVELWSAERVSLDSSFRAGDRIRLAVESPVTGYLYVLNSEISSDGSLGHPHMIFPDAVDQDNSIVPGMLVDIPDQREAFPYFLLNPKGANYAGEAIAIIISPVKLQIDVDTNGKIGSIESLVNLNLNGEAEIFLRTDSLDKLYSQVESQSACGAKARQLEREKTTSSPCGARSRQLTREEPLPQTIYRVKIAPGKPAVALVELRIGK